MWQRAPKQHAQEVLVGVSHTPHLHHPPVVHIHHEEAIILSGARGAAAGHKHRLASVAALWEGEPGHARILRALCRHHVQLGDAIKLHVAAPLDHSVVGPAGVAAHQGGVGDGEVAGQVAADIPAGSLYRRGQCIEVSAERYTWLALRFVASRSCTVGVSVAGTSCCRHLCCVALTVHAG